MADRMIFGAMDATGLKTNGLNFICQRVSKGAYAITFSQAFPSTPAVMVTFTTSGTNGDNVAMVTPSPQNCLVYTYDQSSTGSPTLQDSAFNFVVVGPA